MSHFFVFPRASDFCSLFVSLPSEMNLFYPELIYLPSTRNWTQLRKVDWINFEPHSKESKSFVQGYSMKPPFPPPCFPPQLKLFFPPIQLPQLHWSQILMKLRVEMSVKLQLNVESNSSQIPFLLEIVYYKKTWIKYNSSSSISNWKC